jgi:hypothetical protein
MNLNFTLEEWKVREASRWLANTVQFAFQKGHSPAEKERNSTKQDLKKGGA